MAKEVNFQLVNIKTVKNSMEEITNQTLHEILVRVENQVTKTNGRVSCLENWKNKITGALIIMNLILIPLVYSVIKKSTGG